MGREKSPLYSGRGAVDLLRPHTSIHWDRFLCELPRHPRAEEVHGTVIDCDRECFAPVGSEESEVEDHFSWGVINGKVKEKGVDEGKTSINQSMNQSIN